MIWSRLGPVGEAVPEPLVRREAVLQLLSVVRHVSCG